MIKAHDTEEVEISWTTPEGVKVVHTTAAEIGALVDAANRVIEADEESR